jgi:hypothetical protein
MNAPANGLDQRIPLLTKLLLVVLSPAAADGERSSAFAALLRTLKEVDPGGHTLVGRIQAPPLSQDDLKEAYDLGYQDCAKAIEQARRNALAVTTPRTPGDIGAGYNGYSWREIVGHCALHRYRILNDWESNIFIPSVVDQLKNPYCRLSSKQAPILQRIFERWFGGQI